MSLEGSLYNSVTSKSLSFIRKGNFCMSYKEEKCQINANKKRTHFKTES